MKNLECKNYTTCLDIAAKAQYKDFTCEGCDGRPLTSGKNDNATEAPKTKWCRGILCLQTSLDGVEKPIGDFCKNAATKDKLQCYCRKCTAEMTRLSYQRSKKKVPKENNSAYKERIKNRATTTAARRIYINFDSHPDLYDAVHEEAQKKFRSVNMQFLYWIKKGYEFSKKEEV